MQISDYESILDFFQISNRVKVWLLPYLDNVIKWTGFLLWVLVFNLTS